MQLELNDDYFYRNKYWKVTAEGMERTLKWRAVVDTCMKESMVVHGDRLLVNIITPELLKRVVSSGTATRISAWNKRKAGYNFLKNKKK